MQGMLLSLGSIISDALSTVFGALFKFILTPIINILVKIVIAPLIQAAVTIVQYVLSALLYQLGAFILALLDFVQGLFRSFAGLGGGDPLISIIRNDAIQSAFVSMCAVGLFLLLITTVFQIIKVEYTTEGAKNAKGPIFQKAFKGLCNLMLLPMLVVFGIVLANQVLGLLDSATGGGAGGKISQTIFATAAADSFWTQEDKENGFVICLKADNTIDAVTEIVGYTPMIILQAATEGIAEVLGTEPDNVKVDNDEIIPGGTNLSTINFYKLETVCTYCNYAKINYIIMIFGGFIILKSLFFTCFGLVMRLYKCAILFVISPAVIGMTPVNEGGLGKWRSSFMGQVLSAYGTVLSVNLFLLVMGVLLNTNLVGSNVGGFGYSIGIDSVDGAVDGVLSSNMMDGLVKIIIVIAGGLMIQDFSKQLGGFFGAEDAMSAGGDMAKKVGDTAMKGVAVGAAVGMGGLKIASMGANVVKKGAGIAGKIGKGSGKAALESYKTARASGKNVFTSALSGAGSGLAKQGKNIGAGVAGGAKKVWSHTGGRVVDKARIIGGEITDMKADRSKQALSIYKSKNMSAMNTKKDLTKAQADLKAKQDELKRKKSIGQDTELDVDAVTSAQMRVDQLQASYDGYTKEASDAKKVADKYKVSKDQKKKSDESVAMAKEHISQRATESAAFSDKYLTPVRNHMLNGFNVFTGAANQGMQVLNPFRSQTDQFKKWTQDGAKTNGNEFEIAQQNIDYKAGKRKQDFASGLFGATIKQINTTGATQVVAKAVELMPTNLQQNKVQLESQAGTLSERMQGMSDAQIKNDSNLQSQIDALQNALKGIGDGRSREEIIQALKSPDGLKVDAKIPDGFAEQIVAGIKNGQKPEEIIAAVNRVCSTVPEGVANAFKKAMDEVISKLPNK